MRKLLLLFLAAAAFASCSKINDPNKPHDRLVGILLGQDTLDMYVGEVRQVPLTTNPSNYHTDSLRWKSTDSTVISVSTEGLLTAKKTGQSTISVTNLTGTISVSALVTVGPAPLDSLKMGVVAWYPFSGSAVDSSGNHFNGVVTGATLTANRFGAPNSAYHFNGTSYISVSDAPGLRLNNTDFTINAWVKLDTYNASLSNAVIDKRVNDGSVECWYMGINGTTNVTPAGFAYYGPGGNYPGITTTTDSIKLNTWSMVTTVYNISQHTAKIYVNGVFNIQSPTNIASPSSANNATMYIGSDNPDEPTYYYFQGAIDDIRIYNRTLSDHEISALYTRAN
jgi:hypothetical protein